MQHFQPQRASPPLRSSVSNASTPNEMSGSSVAPELQHLSSDDIDILDAVIRRAGPSATTFFTVFKAYSDVLRERGLDPQEVVYYGKLLKLGTLKGKNWGEKWEMVKAQMGHQTPARPTFDASASASDIFHPLRSDSRTSVEPSLGPGGRQTKTFSRKTYVPRLVKEVPAPKSTVTHPPRMVEQRGLYQRTSNKTDIKEDFLFSTVAQRGESRSHIIPTVTSDDDGEISSPVPPSYKSTLHDPTINFMPLHQKLASKAIHSRVDHLHITRKIALVPKERPKAVDLDDAWKNIKMEQDEKCADEFREAMLLARCWDIWKQGFLWITTTHQQIQEARNKLLLRLSMQRWHGRLASQRRLQGELVAQFMKRHTKRVFRVWQAKLKQRRQVAWRNEMRQKMKSIKAKSELRIKKEVWTKWQQLLLLRRAHQHYQLGLLSRYHTRWKEKHVQLDVLNNIAEDFSKNIDLSILARCWRHWTQSTILQHQESIMHQRVDCRIMAHSFDLWRKHIAQASIADAFRNKMTQKRAIHTWRNSINALRVLDHRAEKYTVRQDEFLLRAVIRIWRARMRGKRLESFKSSVALKNMWQKWRYRVGKEEAQLEVARNFLNRTNSRVVSNAFLRWRQVLTTHRNASAYAAKYDETHLQANVLLLWRIRLRDNLQSVKVARWADRYFATRRAWNMWIEAMEEKKRQQRLKDFQTSKVRRFFNVWRHRASEEQYFKQCERIMQDRIEKRIIHNMLMHWTNRVIEVKSRELDVAYQCDISLKKAAWFKWKTCRRQHVEEVSLLENYLLVRREDVLRRAFYRWITAKRSAEHRRVTHERKEAHLRQVAITSAWEKWRERFKEERLRPLEYEVILANQRNLMHRAFSVWVSKSDSLPAVRFHSKHVKEKVFKLWRNAMPNALRAKKARETDRYNTLVRFFEKWAQTYKTKTTLKAVARAKYLRLPATSSRQALTKSRPFYSGSNNVFPRRRQQTAEEDESQVDDAASVVSAKAPFISRRRPEPVDRARSEKSASRSEYAPSVTRQSSPVRSIVSMPDRRSKTPPSFNPPASLASSGVEGDRLWSAIRKVGQTRRPRNL